MRGKAGVLFVILAVLAWSGVAMAGMTPAAPWTNLAYMSTVTSNDGNVQGSGLASANNGRWHQDGRAWSEEEPCWVIFDLGAGNETDIGYIRWFSISDQVGGPFSGYVQALLPGGDPNNQASWTNVVDSFTMTGTGDGQQFAFADPVTTRALRWVFTQSNAGNNFRITKFEFSEGSRYDLNLANAPGATLTWQRADDDDSLMTIPSVHNGTPGLERFNSNYGGQQYVTLTLPTATVIESLRVAAEDGNSKLGLFSIEYLDGNGEWKTATGPLGQSYADLTGQLNVEDFGLAIPATTGLRLNLATPSTNTGHTILRLYEFAAYAAVPEPATTALLALGGLAMLRRRK